MNGCGDNGHSSHYSGSGDDDMNFEQQALKMEQEDLVKLKQSERYESEDFSRILEGGLFFTVYCRFIPFRYFNTDWIFF